jgi:hypothetical protein
MLQDEVYVFGLFILGYPLGASTFILETKELNPCKPEK